jgi:3-phenylpropionate/trans-cinnamate dioxygenase ferredoxin component
MALRKVATIKDLPSGGARTIKLAGRSVALFNVEGTLFAIDNECTHDGGPLGEGVVSNHCVTCPWHGAEFDLRTGRVLTPPAVEDVRSYAVTVSGDDILVEIG